MNHFDHLRGKNGGPKLSDTLHIRIGTWYRREIGPGMLTGMLRHGITANLPEVVRKAHPPTNINASHVITENHIEGVQVFFSDD